MAKRVFDILLVIPLEEELLEVQRSFRSVEDLSTDTIYRHRVDVGDPTLSMLIVQQEEMGRNAARDAVEAAFDEFDFSLVVCLGIAGSLTTNLRLCDVCYSYGIYDVYDNTKAHESKDGELDIAFSPHYEKCYAPVVAAINFTRTDPNLQDMYAGWQLEREDAARALFQNRVIGRGGAPEVIGQPRSRDCKVVCAAVSDSEKYNSKIRNVDRKIFAIETESGGVISALSRRKVPSITIRGVSDYADQSKAQLEDDTSGHIRAMAAANAASFFKLQFQNPRFINAVAQLRGRETDAHQTELPLNGSIKRDITTLIGECSDAIDAKLRELSPEFKLLDKGYRLPVPRMRNVQYVSGLGSKFASDPEEVREALEQHNAIIIGLAKNYPDASLPWVIASDLLTAVIGGKQIVPVVVDGDAVRPPRIGLPEAAHWNYSEVDPNDGAQIVFVIDGAPLSSKTRTDFLIKQIRDCTDCKFIVITRDEAQIITESEFAAQTNAENYQLTNVSFLEIAHFVEKNFDMTAAEAEVIALRLNDTFNSFDLSAHPTYFAGISKELLSTLLQANRRAELIQLAVDGFLTLVVAGDKANVTLSRTTRARFLRSIVTELKVERRLLTRADVVAMAAEMDKEFGYDIDPTAFVASFIDCGILHFNGDRVGFSLPFVESYLLALELVDDPKNAVRYFDLGDAAIDLGTFDIYCELKPCDEIIDRVINSLEGSCEALSLAVGEKHILLTDAARPAMIRKTDRLKVVEERFNKIADDVRNNRGDIKKKQRMLDMADRVREAVSDRSGLKEDEVEAEPSEEFKKFVDGMRYWATGTQMLGSAAEHLKAETKEKLSSLLVSNLSLLSHAWTEAYSRVDFDIIRKEFTSEESMKTLLNGSYAEADLEEAKRQVEGLVDLLEFSLMAEPLRRLLHHLCEAARLRVLAASVERSGVEGPIDKLAHALWLADIDGKRGHQALIQAMKDLPASPFLRVVVATHLMTRVYWNQADTQDRLRFLDATEIALGTMFKLRKGEIIRFIESHPPKEEK
jgi:nucleoside phosphorylase